jgi:hypothetical protein
MIEGTNRSDFLLRVIQAKDLTDNTEVLHLIDDLQEAFERAFIFAFQLKRAKTEHLQRIGELLRLHIINDKEGTKEYMKELGIKPKPKQPLEMDFEEDY